MPTGYTAPVVEGTITEFRDFAMRCAREFGALVSMRDQPMDAPIPEEFKPSGHHAERLAEAEAALHEATAMSDALAEERAAEAYEKEMAYHRDLVERDRVEGERVRAMLAKVQAWAPPTADHSGLKKFMIEQLMGDLSNPIKWPAPARQTGSEWRRARIEQALRDIAYHRKENHQEIARALSRTEWVRALRASL